MTLERWLNLFALDLLFVMLIVLVLFIVFAPFLPDDVHVHTPQSTTARRTAGYSDDLTISIPRRDFIAIGGQEASMSAVDRMFATTPYSQWDTIRIRAGRDVPFGVIRRVIQSAQQAGHSRVTILVQRPPQPASFDDVMGSTCPPHYTLLASALLSAAIAIAGAVAISLRSRVRPRRPGCAGWFLLTLAIFALLVAWDAARPNCGLWY